MIFYDAKNIIIQNNNNDLFIVNKNEIKIKKIDNKFKTIKNIINNNDNIFILNCDDELNCYNNNDVGGKYDKNEDLINLDKIKMIVSGYSHLFALNYENEIFASGFSCYGAIGNNKNDDDILNRFKKIDINIGIIKNIYCGYFHTFILNDRNELFSTGFNARGQLGLNDEIDRNQFEKVNFDFGIIKNGFCGGLYTFILNSNNELFATGIDILGGSEHRKNFEKINFIYNNKDNNLKNVIKCQIGIIKNIFCGGTYAFILNDKNELFAVGFCKYGQMGLNLKKRRVQKINLKIGNIKNIICGKNYAFILNDKNEVFVSGSDFEINDQDQDLYRSRFKKINFDFETNEILQETIDIKRDTLIIL
jgi:alpha-tubulin suppressor-like RCC1 family protein